MKNHIYYLNLGTKIEPEKNRANPSRFDIPKPRRINPNNS